MAPAGPVPDRGRGRGRGAAAGGRDHAGRGGCGSRPVSPSAPCGSAWWTGRGTTSTWCSTPASTPRPARPGCRRSCSPRGSARPSTRSPRRPSTWPGPVSPCSPGPRAAPAPAAGRSGWTRRTTRSRTPASWSPGWPASRGCCSTGPVTRGWASPAPPTAAGWRCWPPPTTTGSTPWWRRAPGTTWPRALFPNAAPAAAGGGPAACSPGSGPGCCSPRARPGSAPRCPGRRSPVAAVRQHVLCGRFLPSICAMYQQVAQAGQATPAAISLLQRSSPASVAGRMDAPRC